VCPFNERKEELTLTLCKMNDREKEKVGGSGRCYVTYGEKNNRIYLALKTPSQCLLMLGLR
jgi:hypothetical protein